MKRIFKVLIFLLLCPLLSGCHASSEPSEKGAPPEYGKSSNAISNVSKGANEFAFRLSETLLLESKDRGDNFICSPYSVWVAMAAFTNALDGADREMLLTALDAGKNTSVVEMNRAAYRMLYDLTNQGEEDYNPLEIVNAVFVSDQKKLQHSFSQTFMDFYGGAVMNVDFASPDAVDTVNRWAEESTKGIIPQIVTEFNPQTAAMIANAVYYSDRWEWEFYEEATREDVFYGPAGESQAQFMLRSGEQMYYEDDKLQVVSLDFTTGGSLYVILPKEEKAETMLSAMSADSFAKMTSKLMEAEGKLLLPRFSLVQEIELKETLSGMGIMLFDQQNPYISGLIEGEEKAWLSSALQKVSIHVDEKGTTAAAVTTVMEGITSEAMEEEPEIPFEMNCNKPFIIILCGDTYDAGNQILFTGVVNQP